MREQRADQRDRGITRPGNHSQLTNDNGYVETSHLSHDKSNLEIYLSDDVVVMCSPVEHYIYHLIFKKQPELIGLTVEQNDFAIYKTWQRAEAYLLKHQNIEFKKLTRQEKVDIISRVWNSWAFYLEIPFYGEEF